MKSGGEEGLKQGRVEGRREKGRENSRKGKRTDGWMKKVRELGMKGIF